MKVSELGGALLDYWVARAEGERLAPAHTGPDPDTGRYWLQLGKGYSVKECPRYSSEWAAGGPIIQANDLQIGPPTQSVHRYGGPNAGWGPSGFWSACSWHAGADGKRAFGHDKESPLVAAMRCYVMLKFGREVPEVTQ